LLDDDTGVLEEVIQADHCNDVSTCCNKMFVKWLMKKPNATWSQLVTALYSIELNAVAADLKRQLKGAVSCMYMHAFMDIQRQF